MKRISCFVLSVIVFLSGVIPSFDVVAYEYYRSYDVIISDAESQSMVSALSVRDLYDGNLSIELLFDAFEEPSFLLGITGLGYAIMSRENHTVFECGDGQPYIGYENHKKYYGGVLSYYVRDDNSPLLFNITSKEYQSPTIPYIFEDAPMRGPEYDDPITVYKLSNSYFITKYTFGWNETGSCNQIAAGIALNYLRRQYQLPVIPTSMMPEVFNQHWPSNYGIYVSDYPKANSLDQRLSQYFIYSYLVTFGATYCDCVNNYLADTVSSSANRPTLSYTFHPSYTLIKQNILTNKPVIVSTLIDPTYGNHTMVAYGCRKINNGSIAKELLVHVGWYSSGNFNNSSPYTHKEVWLNMNTLSYGYFFSIPVG